MTAALARYVPVPDRALIRAPACAPNPEQRGGVVVLIADTPLGWIVANALRRSLGPLTVICESRENKLAVMKRRARLLGWSAAVGQLAFGIVMRLTARSSRQRRDGICRRLGFERAPTSRLKIHRVASINSTDCRRLLTTINPDAVAVYGTRIISRKTLAATDAPMINYHAGINPKYRGQHPAYWARVADDNANAGVTIHLVDSGVDTGEILFQAPVTYAADDSIQTYQWVQATVGIPLLAKAVCEALSDQLSPYCVPLPSAQNFPPTLFAYVRNGLTKGVW